MSSQRCDLNAMGVQEGIRHRNQATVRRARLCGNNGFELGHVTNRCCDRGHSEGRSSGFEGVQIIFEICRRCRVEQHSDPVDAWRNFLEQFHPLAGHRRRHRDETGDIAARVRNAGHETAANRICNLNEHDRDGARLLQQRRSRGCVCRKNKFGLRPDEFFRARQTRCDCAAGRQGMGEELSRPTSSAVGGRHAGISDSDGACEV